MTKKEAFIKIVKTEIFDKPSIYVEEYPDIFSEAEVFFNGLLISEDNTKSKFTANGKLVLGFMQENKDTYNNLFKAKDIGEGLSISSRTASGAMRKLVTDAFVEKVGENPIIYSLTQKGIEADVTAE